MEIVRFETEREFFEAIFDSSDYVEGKEKLSRFDSEKGTVEVEVSLTRTSDGKKFKANYTRGGQGQDWVDDLIFTEVAMTPKIKKESLPLPIPITEYPEFIEAIEIIKRAGLYDLYLSKMSSLNKR